MDILCIAKATHWLYRRVGVIFRFELNDFS